MFTLYDLVYYSLLLSLAALYFVSLRPVYIGGVSNIFFFRNISVAYFFLFSVVLGKFAYDGTTLISATFNFQFYCLMLYYGIAIFVIGAAFNPTSSSRTDIATVPLNILPFFLALTVKVFLLFVDRTPMQEFLFNGVVEGHLKQLQWHQPGQGGLTKWFYTYFSPVLCILFILYYWRTRSILFKGILFLLMVETSGFYLSKSGMIVPFVVVLALSGIRIRNFVLLLLLGIAAVFYVRLGAVDFDLDFYLTVMAERLVQETGYANTQLELFLREHPPLGYESRYFIGLNTLFGIEPAVDASREAYVMETGRFGATTSGHASVSLFAFWGVAFYVIAPILLGYIFFADTIIVSRLRTDYALVAYLFISFKAINYLTVDIQRLISFQTVINVTFLTSVAIVFAIGKALSFPVFAKRVVLGVGRPTEHA